MTEASDNNAPRTRGRPFQPGNPGRPKGARNKLAVLMDEMRLENGKAVAEAMIQKAKDGDVPAAKLLMDRWFPAQRSRTVAVDLPVIKTVADLVPAHDALMTAVADEQITPDEASTLAGILESRRRAIETTELEQRIAALESKETKKR